MAQLKLDIIPNLSNFKKQVEGVFKLGQNNIPGGGNPSGSNVEQKKQTSGIFALGATLGAISASVGALIANSQAITGLLKIVAGLIDRLVAPFIPILLTLMKPLFSVLLFLSGFLLKFFRDPAGALGGLASQIGAEIKDAVKGTGAAPGISAGLGAAGAGGLALAAGATASGVGIAALLGAVVAPILVRFGIKLGEILFNLINTLTKGKIVDIFNNIVGIFTSLFDIITGLFTGDFDQFVQGFKGLLTNMTNLLKNTILAGVNFMLTTLLASFSFLKGVGVFLFNAIVDIFKSSLNVLKNVGQVIANVFIKAVNALIGLINLIPGVSVRSIRSGSLRFDNNPIAPRASSSSNVTINVNAQTGDSTTQANNIARAVRDVLNTRGAF